MSNPTMVRRPKTMWLQFCQAMPARPVHRLGILCLILILATGIVIVTEQVAEMDRYLDRQLKRLEARMIFR